MPKIHPTAIVSVAARLADDVEIGSYCIIEDGVQVGAGTILREHAIIRRHTTLGSGNIVDAGCVLGGLPQDLKFKPSTVSYLRIGNDNVFREGVTISRATGEGNATTIGSRTYWMAGSHAGHEATIEDDVILINGAVVAGHATVHRRAVLSAHCGVHQFCWIGEGVMMQGHAGASTHVPPFTMIAGGINQAVGLNSVGLRRNPDMTDADRKQIKEAWKLVYRRGLSRADALKEMDAHTEWGAAAVRFRDFIHRVTDAKPPHRRPLCPLRANRSGDDAE